jgi:histone H3/H4
MSDSNEVLVVASKIKTYIKSQGDMKTSASVLEALSDRLRRMCDEAIDSARNDGRKTVLDRDIP